MIKLKIESVDMETNKRVRNWKIPFFVIRLVAKHSPDSLYRFFSKHGDSEGADVIKEIVAVAHKVLEDASKPDSILENGSILAEIEENNERTIISIHE